MASALADGLRFAPEERRRIVICGIGAGFAAVFGTPVAGAILGIEVLAMGDMWYEMLLPSFASAIMAYQVAKALGLRWFYPLAVYPLPWGIGLFLRAGALGVACGLAAYALVLLMEGLHHQARHWQHRHRIWPPWLPTLAGLVLAALVLVVGRAPAGLSLRLLNHALAGQPVAPWAWAWKIIFVAVTLGLGMSGGVITPLFVIGATLGSTLAHPLGLPPADGAALGMMAVTAAGANAPVSAVVTGMELFGGALGPEFLTAAVVAFIMIGHHSVYPSQLVRVQKSPWVPIKTGVALEESPAPNLRGLWRGRRDAG